MGILNKGAIEAPVVALCLAAALCLANEARAQNGQTGVEAAAKRAAAAPARPGDQIALRFMREPQLNMVATVNERGEVVLPRLGIVSVTQVSIADLQDTLRTRYAEFFRAPEVEVSVLRRVVVTGEVKLPNVYMMDGASTVRDAIARAGGVTEMGNKKKVVITRDGRQLHAKGWERDQGAGSDLRSGDQIVVGRKSWLALNILPVISTGILVTSFVIQVLR